MAVTTPKASAGPYIADGKVTQFAFEFPVADTTHVAVYIDGNRAEKGFSVSGGKTGGEVIFGVPPPAGSRIVVLRDVPFTQEMDLQNNTAFLPEVLEAAFDKLTMMCQMLAESDARSVKWLPAMEQEKLPEQLLTDAVNAALDVKTLYPELRQLGIDLREQYDEVLASMEEDKQRVYRRVEELIRQLADAGAMAEDTTIRFEDVPPLTSAATEDERNAMLTEATNIVRRNQEKIDAMPRNLGGGTLTFNIGVQDWEDYEAALGLARYKFNSFFNGKIVFSGGEISSFFTHRNLWFANCCTEIRFCNTRFDTGLSGSSYAVSPGAVRFRHCMLAVFSGCTFTGRFYEVGPYAEDTFGHCIAATDTPVAVPVSFEETLLPQNAELGIRENDVSGLLDANGVPTPELLLKKYELN